MKIKFAAFALCAISFSSVQAMNNDEDELQRAIQLSLQENGNWENPSEFEDLELQQAIELSKQQNVVPQNNKDDFEKIMEQSKEEWKIQEQKNLELILQQSRLEAQQNGNFRGFQVEDEEKEYQRILQESKFLAMMNNIKNKNEKL